MKIQRVLIANRGEIALRIIRTCRRLGIESVAVYSAEEEGALHAAAADRAVLLQGEGALHGYLDSAQLVRICEEQGCDAVHPGYGFLSESASFADEVRASGKIFIGPRPETIRMLGDKNSARVLAKQLGIPVPRGYEGEAQEVVELIKEAHGIGLPLVIKAVAGGGGRGMRLVRSAGELEEALHGARREALQGFGDGRLILEQYIERARHVEVQLLGDEQGCVRHCFERECSVQRRFQKIVEESPAPVLDADVREALLQAAVELGRAAQLVNAATVEFLVSGKQYFLLEANCRLQVEHPVTEAVTGLDLVEQQLRIASGEEIAELTIAQCGAAIEVRVYAEVPERGFSPSEGRVEAGSLAGAPLSDAATVSGAGGVRLESALQRGAVVTTSFDPMLAKIICAGETRADAIAVLRAALQGTTIVGVETNVPFLRRLVETDAFRRGEFFTETLGQRVRRGEEAVAVMLAASPERGDYYRLLSCFTAQGVETELCAPLRSYRVRDELTGEERCCEARVARVVTSSGGFLTEVVCDSSPLQLLVRANGSVVIDGRERGISICREFNTVTIDGLTVSCCEMASAAGGRRSEVGSGGVGELVITSPLPGKVLTYLVDVGSRVQRGQGVVRIESMKMEHTVQSSAEGVVVQLGPANGALIKQGEVLVSIQPLPEV